MASLVKNIRKQRYFFLILFFSLIITHSAVAQENFPFVGQITGDGVNIRAGQSVNFEKAGQLKGGDEIIVLEKSYSWYKIKLPTDAKSYISAKYINELDPQTGEVTTDRVNVRVGGNEKSSILGQAAKGQYVRILEKLEGWYKIEPIDQSFGWINEGYVKFASKEIPPIRAVQALPENIYERKRLAEATVSATESISIPQPTVEEKSPVFVTGFMEGLADQGLAKDIRHILTDENNVTYYLKGPQELDSFLHRKVTVEGTIQSEITASHSVIRIKKINLIL